MRLTGPEPERFITDRVAEALPAYEVTAMLGHGGHAVVLAGRHRRLGRTVAIKVLSTSAADGGAHGRFLAEARLLAGLDHPHVVRIYDYVESGDLCLLVMERLAGGTVRARAANGLTVDVVCAIGLATAAALECAHAGGILHRDIKPDNILFSADGLLKVTDFGIAKLIGASGAAPSTLVGTPVYMAPEQFDGRPPGPACDLYALGIVLYELLSGRPPFVRALSMAQLMDHHLRVAPQPLDAAPPAIAAVVDRALRKEPGARPPSARAFALDLAAATAHALGAGWLTRCPLPLRLDDDVRDAARGSPPARTPPARTPPDTPPSAVPPPATASPRRWSAGVIRRRSLNRTARRDLRPADITSAPLRVDYPYSVVAAPDGAVYVSQRLRHRVLRIERDGRTVHVAGSGKSGPHGDGGPAVNAELDNPCGLALGPDGSLFIADSFNNRIRRVAPDGRIVTVAGSGRHGPPAGPAARHAASLNLAHPHGVYVDAAGLVYVANTGGHQVIRIDPDLRAAPLAGAGVPGLSGDHGPAQFAQLRRPHDVTAPPGRNVYLADTDNHLLRAVDADGIISTAAGMFYGASPDDGAPARIADVGRPHSLAPTPSGGLLVTDPDRGRVRLVTHDRLVRIFADARTGLRRPLGVTVHSDGTAFVVDTAQHLIHRLPVA
ncbi:serine/threonine protein kinase [Frankia casuarinae]|uniref:serine/threonine-protein kinase n=1 Tax=Frankia casuarinae (strain DSM 45818 / CECT 9043 / HFP020203 / CcI3) TaxID=106370 RepID=UPI00044B8365|nr:serine/threonine-protein kinase [Frankia casuarinae]EYT90721.1 serine/threonine protein kinase [Frankia casuarinae]